MTSPSSRRRLGLTGAAVVALLAPIAVAVPAFASSTANEIVYTADDDNDGVYSLVLRDLESRRVTTVLPEFTQTDAEGRRAEVLYDDPELAPGGGRIAFSTDRGSVQFDEGIAVVDRDGQGFRRLTSPPSSGKVYAIDVAPAWSPDSATLLFTRITTNETDPAKITQTTALFTVPAAGGTATAVPNAADGYTGDWSPDGRRIVFAALAPDADSGPITVMNVDGTGRTALQGASGLMPAWSPDGSTIAYATITERFPADRTSQPSVTPEDTTQIATVPVAGGSPTVFAVTRPTSARSVAEYPGWLPDGESIVFDLFGYSSTDSFPPGDVWAVDKAGQRAGRITATPGDEAQASPQGPPPAAVSSGAASTYTPVTPKRLLDTRSGTGAPAGKIGPGGTLDLAVRGAETSRGQVPANASAVVLNLTVTGTTASTDVRAYPSGSDVPGASSLNAPAGATVPNLVTVRIGENGAIRLRNGGGFVHLIADVAGFYTPDSAGAGFAAVDPSRVLDTREGLGAPRGRVPGAGVTDLQVRGSLTTADGARVSVPDDATAVVLNVTATGATSGTDVRVYPTPADGSVPEVSNLNVKAGQTTPNLVTVAVGEGGRVRLRNAAGALDLIADLAGYYSPRAPGRFVPVAPSRFLDTRSGVGAAPLPVTGGASVDLKVAAAPGAAPYRGVPAGATAAVLNLTGTGVTASTDVRAFPVGAGAVPTVSNLNLTRGTTRANLTIVKIGQDGRVRVRNGAGQVNLIGDLAGYMVG